MVATSLSRHFGFFPRCASRRISPLLARSAKLERLRAACKVFFPLSRVAATLTSSAFFEISFLHDDEVVDVVVAVFRKERRDDKKRPHFT